MIRAGTVVLLLAVGVLIGPRHARAQVLVRLGEPGRATYSELHEALREGTPAARRVLAVTREARAGPLWRRTRAAIEGTGEWNEGLLALTRLAELGNAAYADSAACLRQRIEAGRLETPAGRDPSDLLPVLQAIELERARAVKGDGVLLPELLGLVPSGRYGLGEAWVVGRLRSASDSLQARFLAAAELEPKVRYLTLLGFSNDTAAIPLLARVYASPDSFGVPARFGSRASDALLWIGTSSSLRALLEARAKARARKTYADPSLQRGGYDFLANDSSAVISRTGRWLTDWLERL